MRSPRGLLFLCVGTIEQRIGSRDIEDMRGLYATMPVTAIITVLAVVTMILPPFGMLLGKWMVIETAAGNIVYILMLALGSAITVLYWARWAGGLMGAPFQTGSACIKCEDQPFLTRAPLVFLIASAVIVSVGSPWLYTHAVAPMVGGVKGPFEIVAGGVRQHGRSLRRPPAVRRRRRRLLPGAPGHGPGPGDAVCRPIHGRPFRPVRAAYVGPMNKPVTPITSNYYMSALFGENVLTRWVNGGALLLLALMFAMGGLL